MHEQDLFVYNKTMSYYGVKKGRVPGVYLNWDEAKEQVLGFSGAEHKKFANLEEAKAYVGFDNSDDQNSVKDSLIQEDHNITDQLVAYVDGSYDNSNGSYSFGAVFIFNGTIEKYNRRYKKDDYSKYRNVIGELKGAMFAYQYALDNGFSSIALHYDYTGIEMWAQGQWKTNNPATQEYKAYFDKISEDLKVSFVKVDAHTGDKYNEMADKLAKEADFELKKVR